MSLRVRVSIVWLILGCMPGFFACSDPSVQGTSDPGSTWTAPDPVTLGETPILFDREAPSLGRVLVALVGQPDTDRLAALREQGVSLGMRLAPSVYVVRGDARALVGLPFVGGFATYPASAKLASSVKTALRQNPTEPLSATVRFFDDVSFEQARELVAAGFTDDDRAAENFLLHKAEVRVPAQTLEAWAASDLVWQITRDNALVLAPFGTKNLQAQKSIRTQDLQPGGESGYGLTGYGLWIGIWDDGLVRSSHEAFDGRVTTKNTSALSDHATHVAGTLIANGLAKPATRGAAYRAFLDSYDYNADATEMAQAGPKLDLSNHSYGAIAGWNEVNCGEITRCWGAQRDLLETAGAEDPVFGKYGSSSAEWDTVVRNTELPVFKSAGNDP